MCDSFLTANDAACSAGMKIVVIADSADYAICLTADGTRSLLHRSDASVLETSLWINATSQRRHLEWRQVPVCLLTVNLPAPHTHAHTHNHANAQTHTQ